MGFAEGKGEPEPATRELPRVVNERQEVDLHHRTPLLRDLPGPVRHRHHGRSSGARRLRQQPTAGDPGPAAAAPPGAAHQPRTEHQPRARHHGARPGRGQAGGAPGLPGSLRCRLHQEVGHRGRLQPGVRLHRRLERARFLGSVRSWERCQVRRRHIPGVRRVQDRHGRHHAGRAAGQFRERRVHRGSVPAAVPAG